MGLLALFAARTFDKETLLAIVRRMQMSTEIIEKSAFYQEALAKGEARGKAEGLREAALAVLRSRFGEPAADLQQALAVADVAALEGLLPHIATDTAEQVRARLGF